MKLFSVDILMTEGQVVNLSAASSRVEKVGLSKADIVQFTVLGGTATIKPLFKIEGALIDSHAATVLTDTTNLFDTSGVDDFEVEATSGNVKIRVVAKSV